MGEENIKLILPSYQALYIILPSHCWYWSFDMLQIVVLSGVQWVLYKKIQYVSTIQQTTRQRERRVLWRQHKYNISPENKIRTPSTWVTSTLLLLLDFNQAYNMTVSSSRRNTLHLTELLLLEKIVPMRSDETTECWCANSLTVWLRGVLTPPQLVV